MELLEKHFDIAFTAPDGIKKLRELILILAMQGKLVPQDPDDQPASALLKEIEKEKKQLVKEGKIRAQSPLPEIKPDEEPFNLPAGWAWVRLGEIGFWKSGTTPSRSNSAFYGGAIPWVKSGEVKQGRISSTEETITEKALSECSLNINSVGAVLIAMYGANIGEVGILEIEATTNQAVCACTTYSLVDKYFLLNLLMSIKPDFIAQGAGAAQPNISREKIIHTIVPLPPLAEQRRIVVKIDQLMACCDKLDKLRTERERKRISVHTSALNWLLSAQETSTLTDAWQFIAKHFGELYSIKENVSDLRKTILQLAVMGKLVPQDPQDQPASDLLKEIETEKKRLVKEGKIKAPKPLPEINPEEVPYTLPEGWEWCRVWDVAQLITSGSRDWAKYFSDSGSIFVTMGNLSRGSYQLRMDTIRYVVPPKDGEGSRTRLEEYDLLISITGDVGNLGLIPPNFGDAYINQHTCLLRFMPVCKNRYFPELMRTPLAKLQFGAPQRGIKNSFRLGDVGEMIIPLPPIAEQHRIVAKIDQFMALCDDLDKQIAASTQKKTTLLNAVMAQV